MASCIAKMAKSFVFCMKKRKATQKLDHSLCGMQTRHICSFAVAANVLAAQRQPWHSFRSMVVGRDGALTRARCKTTRENKHEKTNDGRRRARDHGWPSTGGHGEITVGYFLEWPMPFQAAKVAGTYDEAMGVKVNWVSFDTGTAMSAAMASGDVQISVSQGVPPFVVATSAGQDLQVLDVAVSYADNDNCVVNSALEIDKDSAGELAGKKVAVPLGTAAHYGFLKQMDHFGVALDSLTVVDMAPAEGEAALSQGR